MQSHPLHVYMCASTQGMLNPRKLVGWMPCYFFFQPTVVIPLSLEMAQLIHIKIQLREPRYTSCVTQGLFQLGGWEQCVQQIGGGTLTLSILFVPVSLLIFSHVSSVDAKHHEASLALFPVLPVFVLWFVFYIVHRNGRTLFCFRVLYWMQSEEHKRGRPVNRAKGKIECVINCRMDWK